MVKILNFYVQYDLFQEKKYHLSKKAIFQIFGTNIDDNKKI